MTRIFSGIVFAISFVLSGARAGEPMGIPACDSYLEKYEACLEKIPGAERDAHRRKINEARKVWPTAAQNPIVKQALESTCEVQFEQMKRSLSRYGCSF